MASLADLVARRDELRAEIKTIDDEHPGEQLPEDDKARWNSMNEELDGITKTITEVKAREERLLELADDEQHVENEPVFQGRGSRGRRVTSHVPDNLYDVAEYRKMSGSHDDYLQALRDGAMKSVETSRLSGDQETSQGNVSRLLDEIDDENKTLALRVLQTGSPAYRSGWAKHLVGKPLNPEEQRALGVGSQGGNYPVPYILDPTVILTSNGVLNPLRAIGRVVNIVGNHWTGVSSTGMSAAYSAEMTETTDGSPTLTQPTADVEKAQAFIPFSIETGEDWGGLQSELARLLQDAKDVLESTKFLSGNGHGSHEPQGLLNGATAIVSAAASSVFTVGDFYSLEQALPPRYVPGASIIANKAQLNKIRQFDTAGGASLWVQLGNGLPSRLLDYPTYQYSAMNSSTVSASTVMTIGDFSNFLILDRVGMNVELIPHIFGTVANYPQGTRGLYAYWRNTTGVLTYNAFRSLKLA